MQMGIINNRILGFSRIRKSVSKKLRIKSIMAPHIQLSINHKNNQKI